MNILRRTAHALLDLEKVRCEKMVRLFRKVGLHKHILEATGVDPKLAAEIESRTLAVMDEGVIEQHALFSRFVQGEITLGEFIEQWKAWFEDYTIKCDRVAFDVFQQAA